MTDRTWSYSSRKRARSVSATRTANRDRFISVRILTALRRWIKTRTDGYQAEWRLL